ncbi:glycerol-3-phosphate 1-O-acyltransferase PlsY [Parvularcula flava]|uniref:Glycerol-3-phosphate acyltransferase n=1 Tax=Aquisalinus luteolus TaxID=1566827 RepID=A0A8J3EQU0_9PROT|nr:glycerol-3-phosphate 1-O-acyltransferase PlsY [Aquisalinus luteolus]NHK27371.1 glycerol-3-phosphate 1-O-acyltransferase PlsY [Aquisalinus luteolus]GGH95234.1 glycerol-3-phosphate acyltransferase [Aquisalinus luteolus]
MMLVLALVLGYLLGSIPFGLVITKLAGLGDIRAIGSGNIGATNVLRTGRKDLALATLLLDSGKGAIAVIIIGLITGWAEAPMALAGAAAFLGHCFPVWLKFKGGKGVATFLGTLLALNFFAGLIACAIWLVTAFISRISSLSALVAAAVSPLVFYVGFGEAITAIAALFMTVLIFIRHRANIERLMAGTEPRIGGKK